MAALPNRRGPLKEVADWTERYRHIWESGSIGWTSTYNK